MSFTPIIFPPWIKWGQRSGASIPRIPGTCAWCHGDLPKRRTAWCSDECHSSFVAVCTWEWVRGYVLARADGRCEECGTTFPGWLEYDAMKPAWIRTFAMQEMIVAQAEGWDGKASVLMHRPWEVDHLIPVALGGTDDPENLRAKCRACHRTKTADDVSAIAKCKRRARKFKSGAEMDAVKAGGVMIDEGEGRS